MICSDKTGTLTMNRMTVTALCEPFAVMDATAQAPSVPLMNAMGLCNDAAPTRNGQGETVLAGRSHGNGAACLRQSLGL